ncbi:MAG: hypothetical protein ACRDYX_16185 [Egibacteraceae bacterium]
MWNICSIYGQVTADPLDALASACDAPAARDLDTLDEARLRADVQASTRIVARVAAERLRTAGRLSGGQAARQARPATSLADPGLQATAAALAAGRISPGQADALAQAARTHPQLVARSAGRTRHPGGPDGRPGVP